MVVGFWDDLLVEFAQVFAEVVDKDKVIVALITREPSCTMCGFIVPIEFSRLLKNGCAARCKAAVPSIFTLVKLRVMLRRS